MSGSSILLESATTVKAHSCVAGNWIASVGGKARRMYVHTSVV